MPRLRDIRGSISSPYLSQHADNPVDWYEWDEDAFSLARTLNRPVFLSIGYAACHWCHVMAHESFEDEGVAAQMNEQFVSIKVDREERPDVDAIYMAATQAVSGHGGWPMSVFLTPEGRPFMAGTYFPPTDQHGQPGFSRLLAAMSDAWTNQRESVEQQADEIQKSIGADIRFTDRLQPHEPQRTWRQTNNTLVARLIERQDVDGGFGGAPKFPRASYVEALLCDFENLESRKVAIITLDAMCRRGLYDHIEGGFARYSVDGQWHVPHFEKMLSDQALLAMVYARADRAAGGDSPWAQVAVATLQYVLANFVVADGLASSIDADSDGVEGAHVIWTSTEVRDVLNRAGLSHLTDRVLRRWSIEEFGSFEGCSIPRLADDEPFTTPDELSEAREALRGARRARPQPSVDDKVILEWNAMFVVAAIESGQTPLIDEALVRLKKLTETHFNDEKWWRTASLRSHAGAADVAWMLEANVSAFETTGQDHWLESAANVATYLLRHYWDGVLPTPLEPQVGAGIFSTSDLVTDLPARPKEVFDGATPSAHAVATSSLARLALCTGRDDLMCVAERLISLAGPLLDEHPDAVPDLVRAYGFVSDGREFVIPGEPNVLSNLVRSRFVPRCVLITGSGNSPLLANRNVGGAYLCRSRVCSLPVTTVEELTDQLNDLEGTEQ